MQQHPYLENNNHYPPPINNSRIQWNQSYHYGNANNNAQLTNNHLQDNLQLPAINNVNNNNINYDNARRQALRHERRIKIKKIMIGICIVFVIIAIVLVITLPIVFTSQGGGSFKYQLLPGYSFTGNRNCNRNFTINLYWENSDTDADLKIIQPNQQTQVFYNNKIGIYGNHTGDQTDGPGPQSYIAPCSVTGQFLIKYRNYNLDSRRSFQPVLKIFVQKIGGGSQTYTKNLPSLANGNDWQQGAAFVISQNPTQNAWNFQLV